ncbi:hypothetical protein CKAH01_06473 [Colletotrichum kahawae]|uniref:Uncharacterized protein n=1 Tax=Colletotrichum kahawae TaxID=34407 RepID=A0AAD9Y9W6_COLKA|nr:hypothetical protein CKAH01_06473 [Colletotrichum kahawae]
MSAITVETAAGVSAFVQDLHNAAQGGPPVDEETLALRMMATANADADFDSSHIKSVFATNGTNRVALDAGTPDRFDAFSDMMMADLETPKAQVDKGLVPKPPPVVIEDPITEDTSVAIGYDKSDALKNLTYLKDAHSVCQMFTNILLLQTNPGGFDITKEAAQAFNVQAKLAYNAMSGPMAGVYNFSQGVSTKHTFDVPKNEVHDKLLATMFDGMGLDTTHKKQIDSQIATFTTALKDVAMDGSPNTFDFALRFGLTPVTNITADDSNPVFAFEPITYLIYLKMDANAFKRSISKNNSQERITLKYEHVVTKFELNVERFLKLRPKYDAMMKKATGKSLKEYGDILNRPAKK